MSPMHHGGNVPGFPDITLNDILAQKSNYTRAAFPSMWHALKTKELREDDA